MFNAIRKGNMKSKHGFLFALLALAFFAVVPAADAAVYVPGLAQAQFDGASTDKTSDIAAAANLTYAAGPIMANTSGSAKDWNNTSWSWAGNRVFGYIGEMWVEAVSSPKAKSWGSSDLTRIAFVSAGQ